jgi:hypothetical protein
LSTTAIALVCIGIRIGWERARRNVLETKIVNSLKVVSLGLNNYESARGFPMAANRADGAGNLLSSWRWQVMPYIEQLPYDGGATFSVKDSWQAKINKDPRGWQPTCFCFSDEPGSFNTSIFAVTGADTAFGSDTAAIRSTSPKHQIIVLEAHGSKVHWMEPGDYKVADLLAAKGRLGDTIKGILPDRIHVLFANSEIWALSPNTPMTALHPFLTITAAKNADRDELLASYLVE